MEPDDVLKDLREITTFGLPAKAHIFIAKTEDDVISYFQENGENTFILGGGSNIIVSPEMEKRNVLKIEIPGIYITRESPIDAYLFAGAGEKWDDVVAFAVHKKLSGIESLSAIPGTAGATPVQNVGAYGSEIKDVLVSLRALDTTTMKFVELSNTDCEFAYRWSIFKGREKGRYVITSIILKLSKEHPKIPEYPAVKKYFEERNIASPSALELREAIVEIRKSKLPSPDIIPNCGSFFENPIVDASLAQELKIKYPDMPEYDMGNGRVKIPAGFLMEKAGLKGAQFGPVGTYDKNALVLINLGGATYEDVLAAKDEIIQKIHTMFGITLETEPEFV